MKKLVSIIFLVLFTSISISQNGINYKALIKDANGNVIANNNVDVEFSILENSTTMYSETQVLTTDQNGIVITEIGNGIATLGTFEDIDWSEDGYTLNVKIDTGDGFVDMGTTQFSYVPYALNAEKANNVTGLEALYENTGNGYRIIGRNPDFYGDLGLDAVDFSVSFSNSSVFGATGFRSMAAGAQTEASGSESFAVGNATSASGDRAVAMGNNTTASNTTSFAMGQSTNASGVNAFAMGQNTTASGESAFTTGIFSAANGKTSIALGDNLTASSFAETVIGSRNLSYTPTSTTSWNNNDRLFTIGNGFNSSRSNALTVLKNGNIGIKTPNPVNKLHITGGTDASLSNASGYITLGDVSSTNVVIDNNEIMARNNGNTSSLFIQTDGGTASFGGTVNASKEINLNQDTASGAAMRVNGDEALWYNGTYYSWGFGGEANYFADNVGIGTTTPDVKLQIVGGNDVQVDNGQGYLILGNVDGRNIALDENEIMARDNNGTSTLNLNINGGRVATGSNLNIGGTELLAVSDVFLRTSTSFTPLGGTNPSLGDITHQWWSVYSLYGFATTSDRRKKTNIKKLNYGLEEVMKLKPVSYKLKKYPEASTKIGFIAQDLQQVLPEVIVTKENSLTPVDPNSKNSSDTMAVFYSEIIPVLTKAIQEQQQIIESQNKKIERIEMKLNTLLEQK